MYRLNLLPNKTNAAKVSLCDSNGGGPMRRRPMEFWWISAYCVVRAALVFCGFPAAAGDADRALIVCYGAFLFCVPFPLLAFQPWGRWTAAAALGAEAIEMGFRLGENAEIGGPEVSAALAFAGCLWMSLFLQRPSTARLFRPDASQAGIAEPAAFDPFRVLDVGVALLAGWGARMLGASVWISMAAGFTAYVLYGTLLEEWLRQRWDAYFARIEPGFPENDARLWRAACCALGGNDLDEARERYRRLSPEAQQHPAGRLFKMVLSWRNWISCAPTTGRAALRRLIFDHEYTPGEHDRGRIGRCADRIGEDELRRLADDRAEFIGALILGASNPRSFFRLRAIGMLSRVTGETFAFDAPGNWAEWWRVRRAHWTGDAGPVAIVARLLCRDCHAGAAGAARKISGRAEEPLLTVLAEQMLFFVSMRDSNQSAGAPHNFMDNPLRVLLVPEWTDAIGWLHADSPVLANLGVSRDAAARRLVLRARLLDYAASFWKRYPADLNDDPSWLLPLLAGKNFGVLWARSKFQTWWPKARGGFLRHAQAMNAGLSAFEKGDWAGAERAFNAAIVERAGELSARYNLALCRSRQGHPDEAVHLLRELTAMEPKEPYWWMALGDLHRALGKALAARNAYRRAQKLGASEGRVALHLGLTFAHEERDGEAMRLFARALGKNPTASKLEALATQLESEGCWKLAGHYREVARRMELGGPGRDGEAGDRGDETTA